MLILPGAPALSAFRLDKLHQKLSTIHPDLKILHAGYMHFADLSQPLSDHEREVLDQRLAAYRANPDLGDRWEIVRARVQKSEDA